MLENCLGEFDYVAIFNRVKILTVFFYICLYIGTPQRKLRQNKTRIDNPIHIMENNMNNKSWRGAKNMETQG